MIGNASERLSYDSEELHRSLFELSPMPTVIFDGQVMLRINKAAARAFGFRSRREAVGRSFLDFVHPDSREDVVSRVRMMLRTGEPIPPVLERFLRVDGSTFEGEAVASSVDWDGGRAIHVIVRDVTDIQRAQDELMRSEARYRELFELTPDPVIVHDGEHVLMANAAAACYLGLSAEKAQGASIWDFLRGEQREAFAQRICQLTTRTIPARPLGVLLSAADGTEMEAELISTPTLWEGMPVILSVFRDLTARAKAERALRQSEERFHAVVEQAPVGMHVYELDSVGRLRFVAANEAADTILCEGHKSFIGMPIEEALPGLRASSIASLRRIAEEGGSRDVPRVDYDDGRVRGVFEVHSYQISQGQLAVMFWDISAKVRDEEELAHYRERLEELVVERTRKLAKAHRDIDAITAIASHAVELRDPYTAGHQRRVALLAEEIAKVMGLDEEQVGQIVVAAKLHDIGKLSIPAEILSKPGRLMPVEYELVKGHAMAAHEMLSKVDIGWPLEKMVVQHHERMDGSGYPFGLGGSEIMDEARILAVADVVEAMSSHRPYRPSLGMALAMAEIEAHRSKLYDSNVVDACLAVIGSGFEFGDV